MIKKALKWVRQYYMAIINSIAFYPVIIAICFLLVAITFIAFDFSAYGNDVKANAKWLSLKDSSTARTIIATIAAGIISLAVFSFSMVMILLNQAATNMSNRILDIMIGNRFHQFVLGFYIGTIVFAFTLLSTIRDAGSDIQIPSLSIYFLIFLTIADIFLFIYFLHYITQSVKYETIISRIYDSTNKSFTKYYSGEREYTDVNATECKGIHLYADKTGYYQGFAEQLLTEYCREHNCKIIITIPIGTYLLKGSAIAVIDTNKPLDEEHTKHLSGLVDIFEKRNNISSNPYMGCMQLSEIAIKALSPGINDPGTAILSLNTLMTLLTHCAAQSPANTHKDKEGAIRIITYERTFEDYINDCVLPIWDYGKNDRMIQQAFKNILPQLKKISSEETHTRAIQSLLNSVNTYTEQAR